MTRHLKLDFDIQGQPFKSGTCFMD